MSHTTEVRIPNGKIICQAESEIFKKTKCFKCQQEIHIIYTTAGPKLPVSLVDGKWVTHEMCCPNSELARKYKKEADERKRYEERITTKNNSKKKKKHRRFQGEQGKA